MTAHIESKGPLWAQPQTVAQGIFRAIERRSDIVYLPWFWRWIMLVIRLIPEPLFKRPKALTGRILNTSYNTSYTPLTHLAHPRLL